MSAMEGGEPTRKPRSDGQRNRARVVQVARQHFREVGINASLEAIAREASVGPATLYRHFPTRDHLVAAVLELRDDDVVRRLAEIERLADPVVALEEWMVAVEGYLDTLNDLVGPMGNALADGGSPISISCQWLVAASERILERAQGVGGAAADLRGRDILYAAFAIAWVRHTAAGDSESVEAFRRAMMRGLRAS